MQSDATITFTQPGVQPPVYVVTSLSTPPWATLELKPSEGKTPSGDLVFEQKFANVHEGSYQYKIRIGEGHWVVDESKETATDDQGNRNNVVHVKSALSSPLDRTLNVKDKLDRKDSTVDNNDARPEPVPFVVVEKVEDKDQPEYGHVESKTLAKNESKRTADPKPDFEAVKKDSPLNVEAFKAPEFDELEPPDAQAPLFRHESFQDSGEGLPEAAMDKIEEESTRSSTDPTSSEDIIYTPSAESQDDLQYDDADEDELGNAPLMSHETGFVQKSNELKKTPLFSHETSLGAEEDDSDDEFDAAPLLSHETGFTNQSKADGDDYDESEFDAAPLLPHETGFSSYKDSEATSKNSRFSSSGYDYEPEHYAPHSDHSDGGEDVGELNLAPTFSHEQGFHHDDDYDGEPLLPHERGSVAESFSGSERSFSMSPTTYENPSFGRDTNSARELFGGSMRGSFFRARTSSSTLPDKLPRSDAEDNNLHDPGLEIFPVGREQILERVATIGHKLPEDETHAAPGSPDPSVLSQACSSVDLKPVKSYISLASVQEDEEEAAYDSADMESIGSPMVMGHRGRYSRNRDPLATPHPDDNKQLGFVPEETLEPQGTCTADSSEAGSVSKTDGSRDLDALKTTTSSSVTPALTPKALEVLDKENSSPPPESELRQRREPVDGRIATAKPSTGGNDGRDVTSSPTMKSATEKLTPDDSSSQSWKGAR
ncbi:hypothetical protein E8E13_004494 [Curvularia kusanoi]|uniref:AMP-activated protein kinase glycogen-binding domain-containing protein n=1 Tax=Curvularia kusanoi TaxID=90978 RepID=A0A9P4T672_CURKU|nr:hypothetical protein E8E13_004494 [Curvularia kusanoi]